MSRDQWIKQHFENDEDEEEKQNQPKVGTTKKRREFETEVNKIIDYAFFFQSITTFYFLVSR